MSAFKSQGHDLSFSDSEITVLGFLICKIRMEQYLSHWVVTTNTRNRDEVPTAGSIGGFANITTVSHSFCSKCYLAEIPNSKHTTLEVYLGQCFPE